MNIDVPFGEGKGKRLDNNRCKVRQGNNGQFSITIPSCIAKKHQMEKGDVVRYEDEGLWIKMLVKE